MQPESPTSTAPDVMHIIVLNSGSNGNAVYVESRRTGAAVLLDCGISRRQIEQRLREHGRMAGNILGIFITHEHQDHIRGLPAMTKIYHAPVYATEPTIRSAWQRELIRRVRTIANSDSVTVEDITIRAIPKSHDAADAVLFHVTIGVKQFIYATDLGIHSDEFTALLPGLDALLLESNYDTGMLMNGSYPADIKERIDSSRGHLSNRQAMDLLERHCDGRLQLLILGHISENNNTHAIVRGELESMLSRKPECRPRIHLASRHQASELFSV